MNVRYNTINLLELVPSTMSPICAIIPKFGNGRNYSHERTHRSSKLLQSLEGQSSKTKTSTKLSSLTNTISIHDPILSCSSHNMCELYFLRCKFSPPRLSSLSRLSHFLSMSSFPFLSVPLWPIPLPWFFSPLTPSSLFLVYRLKWIPYNPLNLFAGVVKISMWNWLRP